jgi:hypothetical protein
MCSFWHSLEVKDIPFLHVEVSLLVEFVLLILFFKFSVL